MPIRREMNLILLGAPGSGKGSLAKKIIQDFEIPQISTGELFRECVKANDDFGKKVKEIMASGQLIADEITIKLVKDRLAKPDCKNGFLLDGFPRNIAQAEALEKIAKIDNAIFVDLDQKTIIERLSTRRTCSSCGEIYSSTTFNGDVCTKCNGPVIQRDDDKPESIKSRLEVYEKNTSPLINFYGERLFKVSNDKSIEETYRPVKTFLEKLREAKSE